MKYFIKNLFIPFREIDQFLPDQGIILDLGCGEGAITFSLASKSKRRLIGLDANQDKINQAQTLNSYPNTSFINADLLKVSFPRNVSGCIVSDVLHHLSRHDQIKLIHKISKAIKPQGTLIIKEINSQDMIRSKLSRLWDLILYPKDKINYLSKSELIERLEKNSFKVTHKKMHCLVPASINLYIAQKI